MMWWYVIFANWKNSDNVRLLNIKKFLCQVVCITLGIIFLTGRSVVWLARLLWEQEAVSSNLTVPTNLPTSFSLPLKWFFPVEIDLDGEGWSINVRFVFGWASWGWLVQKNLRVRSKSWAWKRWKGMRQFHSLLFKGQWNFLSASIQIRWDLVLSLGDSF